MESAVNRAILPDDVAGEPGRGPCSVRTTADRERFARKVARGAGSDARLAILIGAAEARALLDAISSASAIARTARG